MTKSLGLYIHIPFCARKCAYCDFYSLPGKGASEMDAYLKALLKHIVEAGAFTGKKAGSGGFTVDTIYFGGGTPPLFGASRLAAVLGAINKSWNVSKKAEISLEANPESVDFKTLKKLRRAGFNRLSVGLQSTDSEQLRLLGRAHTAEQAADCVRMAAKAGFDNIGVDLMYGVPGQDNSALLESLRAVTTWGLAHVSLYGLKLEEGTPLFDSRDSLDFPSDDEQAEGYLEAVALLEERGFEQYEISNFAKPGRLCRHNMKYWTLKPYIGFGPAAHSDFGGKRYSNARSLESYIAGIRAGDAVIDEISAIPVAERAGEYIMCGLRTAHGISDGEYLKLFRVALDPVEKKLERFAKFGYAQYINGRWRLTPKGFLVSNRILGELLDTDTVETGRA